MSYDELKTMVADLLARSQLAEQLKRLTDAVARVTLQVQAASEASAKLGWLMDDQEPEPQTVTKTLPKVEKNSMLPNRGPNGQQAPKTKSQSYTPGVHGPVGNGKSQSVENTVPQGGSLALTPAQRKQIMESMLDDCRKANGQMTRAELAKFRQEALYAASHGQWTAFARKHNLNGAPLRNVPTGTQYDGMGGMRTGPITSR